MRAILDADDADRCLKYPAAAQYLGLSKRTLQRLVVSGQGPQVIRYGRRSVRFSIEDLRRFRDDRRA